MNSHEANRRWSDDAIRRIEAEGNRSADTHLFEVPVPAGWSVKVYLKDESTHRTGSLKHRLARSLFLFGLVNGWITRGMTIVEASSGSTAVSEAYFAQLLDLPFVAVMPRTTSAEKIALIEQYNGTCHFVDDPSQVYAAAEEIARSSGGHYMDQFTYAERATDWRGNNNIAESIYGQLALEESPVPEWIVVGAGTGGTTAMPRSWPWWIRKIRCSIRPGAIPAYPLLAAPRGLRASAGRGWNRVLSPPSSIT
jgi:cysteine synthase A